MKIKERSSELWKVGYQWIKECGNSPNEDYFKEEITTHPDYPALTALIDVLEIGKMEFYAVEAEMESVADLNYPALIHIQEMDFNYMHIIKDRNSWEKEKEVVANWTGIVIFPEINTKWDNSENRAANVSAKNRLNTFVMFSTLLLILFLIKSWSYAELSTILLGTLSLPGLLLSVSLISSELGFQNKIVRQVCGVFSEGGCETVMRSSYAKGLFGISPALAALAYFTAQFITFMLLPSPTSIIGIFFIPVSAGILVGIWSIYVQGVRIKDWCTLCLGIVGILFTQAIVILVNAQISIALMPFLSFTVLFILLLFPFFFVRHLLSLNIANSLKIVELRKWKSDRSLFLFQLNNQPAIIKDNSVRKELILGNLNAPLKFTIACSPYCNPCAVTHRDIHLLIDKFPGLISLNVKLICPMAKNEDKFTTATKAILTVAAVHDGADLSNAVNDWFEIMDLDKWAAKWKPDYDKDVIQEMKHHNHWMNSNQITHTPTLFLNEKKIPSNYTLKDIEILIPQLNAYFSNNAV